MIVDSDAAICLLVKSLAKKNRLKYWENARILPVSRRKMLGALLRWESRLGTQWGLFRHYWVLTKFILTVVSTLILFAFTRTLSDIGVLAADTTLPIDELRNLSQSPVLHSGGGLLVLLVNTTLSVYKPWGRTRYGLRKQQERNKELLPKGNLSAGKHWGRYILFGIIGLLVLFVVLHLVLRSSH